MPCTILCTMSNTVSGYHRYTCDDFFTNGRDDHTCAFHCAFTTYRDIYCLSGGNTRYTAKVETICNSRSNCSIQRTSRDRYMGSLSDHCVIKTNGMGSHFTELGITELGITLMLGNALIPATRTHIRSYLIVALIVHMQPTHSAPLG